MVALQLIKVYSDWCGGAYTEGLKVNLIWAHDYNMVSWWKPFVR